MREQILNELYIGKTPIIPLQNQFSIIRNKIKGKSFSNSINTDKDILKFNRMVEKLFGFNSFALNISPDQTINAYTFGTHTFRSKEEVRKMITSLKASNNGFYHDASNGIVNGICTLNIGLINCDNISDDEIIACILHEIGHNFFEAVTDKDCVYSLVFNILKILRDINIKINNNISSGKEMTLDAIKSDVDDTIQFFDKFGQLNNLFVKIKNNIFSIPHAISSTARSAVMYGYGPELHSFLRKIEEYYIKMYNIKQTRNTVIVAFKVFKALLIDSILYTLNIMDPHPNDLARIKVSIEYLKRELAKESLDPKVKIQLLQQVEEMQKLIDDYINFPKDEDNIAIIRAYYRELYKRFGGDRREQDTDNKALFDTIDKRFDEILNSK